MADDNDGFQLNSGKKKKQNNGGGAGVRLYLGGLPSSDHGKISDADLKGWLQQNLPSDVEIGAIDIKHGSKNAKKASSFALVECGGNKGINDIVRILKQNSNGEYEGNKVTIQREQRTGAKANKARQRSGNNHTGKRQFGGKGRSGGNNFSRGPSLTAKGWSKPSSVEEPSSTIENEWDDVWDQQQQQQEQQQPVTSMEEASETIAGVVSEEIAKANNVDEKINAAIASTAATTMMTSLMGSLGFGQQQSPPFMSPTPTPTPTPTDDPSTEDKAITDFSSFAKGQSLQGLLDEFGDEDPDWKKKIVHENDADDGPPASFSNGNNFASFAQGQFMAGLLADFGEADPDWKTKIVDDGNDDDDDDETKTAPAEAPSAMASRQPTQSTTKSNNNNSYPSRLAVKGRAPIHLSIESFGFAHGAPPRKNRNRSGSPYTQPMGLLSVGDDITDPVPTHLEFHDGLRSGVIKRMMKAAPLVDTTSSGKDDVWTATDRDETDTEPDLSDYRDFCDYCRKYLAESRIFPSLREAIYEGGHGYVSPLTMTFQIGSRLGRHRSVVAAEWVAQHLRSLLRNNTGGKIPCSVSVGTVHRDVSKRIPQKTYREDSEDADDKNDRV
eukprot:jgi/Psemu1/6019/gm1.6019_g